MTTLLITGGTGFLGSWILQALEELPFSEGLEYDTIRLLVRNPEKARGMVSKKFRYEIVEGNLLDHESLRQAASGVDAVIHVAALFDVASKWSDFKKANIEGTEALIQAMNPGTLFVLTSTIGVYGVPDLEESIKEDFKQEPIGNYQKSKKMQEDLARSLCKERGISFVAIRPSNIIGPRDHYTVPVLIKNILAGKFMFTGNGGKNTIPVVHPWDVAKMHVQALKQAKDVDGNSYHVASCHVTMKDYIGAFCRELNVKPVTKNVPYPIAYTFGFLSELLPINSDFNRFTVKFFNGHMELDMERIREDLGYEEEYNNLDRIIKESVEWYQEEKPEARA